MKVLCLLALVLCVTADDPRLDGTELLLTFLIHRHGDRTPVESSLRFASNPEQLVELSEPYGYGQLTKQGKQSSYKLGQFLRNRYNELLSPQYNSSEVYIRSTDSTRAKMTILTALAAIYPPGPNSWSDDIHWTPVPYTTVPVRYDFNLPIMNCPTFLNGIQTLSTTSSPALRDHKEVLDLLTKEIGVNITNSPMLTYLIHDVYISQLSLGLPLKPKLQAALPDIASAAAASMDILFSNEKYLPYQAGVLLQQFYNVVDKLKSGEQVPTVHIYSAHDVNVISFKSTVMIPSNEGVPKYASAFALELRRVIKTNQLVVLPVYLPSPGEKVKYVKVKGCGLFCDYDQFVRITSKNALDEDTWRSKCGYTPDLVIDESSIN